MNTINLTGRLCADPFYKESTCSVAKFKLAVDRDYKKDETVTADFPEVVAFGKTAEVVHKYLKKGSKIGVTGRLQTNSYEGQDGKKVYTTSVVAEHIEFLEKKTEPDKIDKANQVVEGFEKVEDDLPF